MMPFFSTGSCQLTLSDVSRISMKLRCPTAPGSGKQKGTSAVSGRGRPGFRSESGGREDKGRFRDCPYNLRRPVFSLSAEQLEDTLLWAGRNPAYFPGVKAGGQAGRAALGTLPTVTTDHPDSVLPLPFCLAKPYTPGESRPSQRDSLGVQRETLCAHSMAGMLSSHSLSLEALLIYH